MKISLVIRCYNEERYIGRLLDGVTQQTANDVEIIVVDSGSTDSTLSIVARYPVKLHCIKPEEFSFGRSLNIGCRAASGDIIVIASAHVYPMYQDWMDKLVAPFADPQVALVYGKQRGDETTKFSEHQVFAKWFPDQSDLDQDHPFCNNANAAIRRPLWEERKYDENLTGLEDTDWAKYAMEMGHKVAYVANADVVHVHDESLRQTFNRYRREAIAFKGIFPHERFGLWEFVGLFVGNVVSDFLHARRDHVLLRNVKEVLGFRLMQFWGAYRGFKQRGLVSSQLKQTFYYPNRLTKPCSKVSEYESHRRIRYTDDSAEQHADGNG